MTGLKAIISTVTSTVRCPHCDGGYDEDHLVVVSAIDARAILVAQCHACSASILVTAAVQAVPAVRQLKDGEVVSLDDVSSIHRVLQEFKGDISSLIDGSA